MNIRLRPLTGCKLDVSLRHSFFLSTIVVGLAVAVVVKNYFLFSFVFSSQFNCLLHESAKNTIKRSRSFAPHEVIKKVLDCELVSPEKYFSALVYFSGPWKNIKFVAVLDFLLLQITNKSNLT